MRQVLMYQPQDSRATYCLDDPGRRAVLVNLEQYRAALESCNTTINIYNAGE